MDWRRDCLVRLTLDSLYAEGQIVAVESVVFGLRRGRPWRYACSPACGISYNFPLAVRLVSWWPGRTPHEELEGLPAVPIPV